MRDLFACLILLATSSVSLAAGNVAKEINAYRSIEVNFSKNANKCNLTDSKMFEDHLRKELFKIGISENTGSIATAILSITANSFGVLGARCNSQVVLSFETILGPDNIVVDNPAIRQAIDRLERIPVIFWQAGIMGVQAQTQPSGGGESTAAREAVLEMATNLVERLKAAREPN